LEITIIANQGKIKRRRFCLTEITASYLSTKNEKIKQWSKFNLPKEKVFFSKICTIKKIEKTKFFPKNTTNLVPKCT